MPIGKSSIARAAKANEKAAAPEEKKNVTVKSTKAAVAAETAKKAEKAKTVPAKNSKAAKAQNSAVSAPAAVNTGVISALSPEVMEKVIEKKPAAPENENRVSLGEDMPYFLL